jgi:hypothetical protein
MMAPMKSKSDFWLVLQQLAGKLQIEADSIRYPIPS